MKKIVLAVFVTFISACSTQTFYINNQRGVEPDKEVRQAFFIGGIGQQSEMDPAAICGGVDKVAKVEAELTFLDGFLNFITFSIYTPRTARVYCTRD